MKRIMTRFPGRPYPKDHERWLLVKIELAKRGMTITDLSDMVDISRPNLSAVINGTRRSPQTEEKIAAFFGLPVDRLFPPRTNRELLAMREAQKKRKGDAA